MRITSLGAKVGSLTMSDPDGRKHHGEGLS